MPLAALNLPVHSLSNEVGSLLALLQNGVDAVKGSLREARRGLFVVDLFSAHLQNIDDITNCYKSQNKRYHLFQSPKYLISSKTSERRTQMTNKPGSIAFVEAFLAASEAEVIKLEQNAIDNPAMARNYRAGARRLAKKNAATRAMLATEGF